MTRKPAKGKSQKTPARRSTRASGAASVRRAALGSVSQIVVQRGGRSYVHEFGGATLHEVEGQPGVLVIVGRFSVKGSFIHNSKGT